MDWFWKSSSKPLVSSPSPEKSDFPPQSQLTPTNASSNSNANSEPLSRDELADRELQSFLQELETSTSPNSSKYNRVPRSPPSSSSPLKPQNNSPSSTDSLAESLLPTTMSCREAFDSAFYCQSIGGKFNDIYRAGGLQSCSEHWGKFWFCMKTRTYGSPQKEEVIKGWYRKRENRLYKGEAGESSEDVWMPRDRKLGIGEAFSLEEGEGWRAEGKS